MSDDVAVEYAAVARCRWCGDSPSHDDIRCLREQRDHLEEYFREAVDALAAVYLQAGGKYASLMSLVTPASSLTLRCARAGRRRDE